MADGPPADVPLPLHGRSAVTTHRIGVLINPRARGNRKDPMDPDTVQALVGDCSVFVTRESREVPGVVGRLLDDSPDLLVVSGGDGTLHLLLTEVLRQRDRTHACDGGRAGPQDNQIPTFLMLRGGTMNMAANNLSTSRAPLMELRVLGRFLRGRGASRPWPVRTVSPLRIEADHLDHPLYGLVFANGIAFRILNEYYRGTPSVTRAFNVTASIIAGAFMSKELERRYFTPLNATVRVDGEVADRKDLRISVASAVPKLLLWFTIFENHPPLAEDQFHFLANFLPTREIARHFWGLCRGQWEGPGHLNHPVRHVELVGPGGFTVDGEVYDLPEGTGRCVLTAGPPVRFLDLSGFALPGHTWTPDPPLESPGTSMS